MMTWLPRASQRRTTAALAVLALVTATSGFAAAADTMKDAKVATYTKFGSANQFNLRLDKVERVEHIDARPIASDQNLKDPTNGYLILSFSMQNTGDASNIPNISVTSIFDDESEMVGHASGPFVGSGRAYSSGHAEKKQTIHERIVQMNIPADRKITKIILDPNDGGAKLRYTIKDADLPRLPEIPLPAAP
jgi:hypothetical protein